MMRGVAVRDLAGRDGKRAADVFALGDGSGGGATTASKLGWDGVMLVEGTGTEDKATAAFTAVPSTRVATAAETLDAACSG